MSVLLFIKLSYFSQNKKEPHITDCNFKIQISFQSLGKGFQYPCLPCWRIQKEHQTFSNHFDLQVYDMFPQNKIQAFKALKLNFTIF